MCDVTLQGEPGKNGLDGLPGADGSKVTSDFSPKNWSLLRM